jgi:hypothetical protein
VLVTQLCEGQRVTVLQLPVTRQPAERRPDLIEEKSVGSASPVRRISIT